MTIHAYTDGASRGNPGDSGIGIVLKDENGTLIDSQFGFIGTATNNIAEYTALLACLKLAQKHGCTNLVVHSDSELMVRQLNGKYKVKDAGLKKQFLNVRSILMASPFRFEIRHVPREQNRDADRLANRGIDSKVPLAV